MQALKYPSNMENSEDRAFFEEIYEKYRRELLRYAKTFLKDGSNAEDVVQEVFLSVVKADLRRFRDMKDGKELRAYLLAATRYNNRYHSLMHTYSVGYSIDTRSYSKFECYLSITSLFMLCYAIFR